jgi:hypothetical protein
MNAKEYRRAIERLDLNQSSAAALFDINPSTSRRYAAAHPIPRVVAILLRMMVKYDISAEQARALVEWKVP